MIKIFRNIRKSLIEKNKTGKYFKYAIGEIILVVIGILIALQINNWNENRKLKSLKQDYLQSLLADLEEDAQKIKDRIGFSKDRMAEYEAYEKAFDTLKTSQEVIDAISKTDSESLTLTFKTNTVEVLIATGDIKLIKSELRNKIIDLDNKQKYIDHIVKRNIALSLEQFQEIGRLGWNDTFFRWLKNNHLNSELIKKLSNEKEMFELLIAVESVFNHKYKIESIIAEGHESLLTDITELKMRIQSELN